MAQNQLGKAIMAGLQGFQQGQQMRRQNQKDSLSELLANQKILDYQRKTTALAQPSPEGYFRDPYSGKLLTNKNQLTPANQLRQFQLQQQFGVDPITGEEIPEEKLRKPRFGYTGDQLGELLAGLAASRGQ